MKYECFLLAKEKKRDHLVEMTTSSNALIATSIYGSRLVLQMLHICCMLKVDTADVGLVVVGNISLQ